METFVLDKDIHVCYVKATSFPEGIAAAHEKLHSLAPASGGRKFFGISRPEHGEGIVYKAAAEELFEGELNKHGLESFIIPKGNYLAATLHNYRENMEALGETFQEIIHQDEIDPQGYCIEWYINEEDVKCMVKLQS
jgi:predicted transcriptional regulator YdeE